MRARRSLFKPQHRNRNFFFSVVMTTAKMIFLVVLILGMSVTGAVAGVAKAWVDTAPALDLSVFNSQAQTSFIYDKNGALIMTYKGTENRIYCSLDEVPYYLQKAVISIEDARFYTHNGVDIKRYLGAFAANLLSGENQGGSTITCQLIKQTMLSSEQTYKRKVQEAYLAVELEKKLATENGGSKQVAKDTILEEYLNVVYMGGSLYGVKIAAQDYFGKELSQLTLRECAMLARMIRNPSRYNPRANYYTRNTPNVSEDGADWVLREMLTAGYISQDEYNQALSETLQVLPKSTTTTNDMYDNAYYVEYSIYDVVTKMLRSESMEDNATNRSAMESKLRTGGYHVYTSLDPDMQSAVQDVVANWSDYPETRYSADQTYKASIGNGEYTQIVQPQVAAAVMDWHTGELVAVIGGRNEPTARKQLNRAYQMSMPVGSSIKPLSVYGPAFDMGWSPGTPVLNLPIPIEGWDSQLGYPTNFGGGSYTGCETMRYAINKSHNYSTAQALFQYVGLENSVIYLKKLGVSEGHILATGSGLALGSSGISVVEMAAAFGAIANQGVYQEPYAFSRILEADNQTVYMNVQDAQVVQRAFKASTAWMLVDVLKGCASNIGTGEKAQFGGFTIAGKTGTNSDACGVFFAGMTAYYSGAVWIGHDGYKPLVSSATGGAYAAPLWAAVMRRVHSVANITEDKPIIDGAPSDYGLVLAKACGVSGMKPTTACANDATGYSITEDYYLEGTEPTVSCNMHRQVQLCTRSKKRPTAACKSVRTYGIVYIPVGHPLRQAETLSEVQEYFHGASLNKDAAAFGTCTVCR